MTNPSTIRCAVCGLPQFRCLVPFANVHGLGLHCKPCVAAHETTMIRAEREARLEQAEWLKEERDDLWHAHFREKPKCPACSEPLDIGRHYDDGLFVFCDNIDCDAYGRERAIPDPVRGLTPSPPDV